MACPCDLAGITAALPAAMPALNLVFALSVLYYAIRVPQTAITLLGIGITLKAIGNPLASNGWLSGWMLAAGIFCIWDMISRVPFSAGFSWLQRRAKYYCQDLPER